MLFESQIHDLIQMLPFFRKKTKKKEMRATMQQRLRRLTTEDRALLSAQIVDRIEHHEAFQKAKVVMLFYPIQHEPDIRPLLEKYKDEKVLLLPVAHRKDIEMRQYIGHDHLRTGHFGIPEPTSSTYNGGAPELIIIPGVAFDKDCNRLGRGGGYYDRFLVHFSRAVKLAVAYDFQVVKRVPMGHHDVKIDGVITPGTEFVRK